MTEKKDENKDAKPTTKFEFSAKPLPTGFIVVRESELDTLIKGQQILNALCLLVVLIGFISVFRFLRG